MNYVINNIISSWIFSEQLLTNKNNKLLNLEDELQTAEDARLRCEVNIGALETTNGKTCP